MTCLPLFSRVYVVLCDVNITISPTIAMQYHHFGNFLRALCTFASHFPKESQYLVNGELDEKSDTNEGDMKSDFLSGVRNQI